jgi:hypothetical protein
VIVVVRVRTKVRKKRVAEIWRRSWERLEGERDIVLLIDGWWRVRSEGLGVMMRVLEFPCGYDESGGHL